MIRYLDHWCFVFGIMFLFFGGSGMLAMVINPNLPAEFLIQMFFTAVIGSAFLVYSFGWFKLPWDEGYEDGKFR